MAGWGKHKVVLDKGRLRVYYVDMDWGLNFLSVRSDYERTQRAPEGL